MDSSNIRDILASFSPSLDFLAVSSGDGRIKIWNTLKGQVQTEFSDIMSAEEKDFFAQSEVGHLSVDYTCMKWLSLRNKKKRKFGSSLLVLGNGSGDVLALDASAGQLKWRISDCHPEGVTAISFPTNGSCIYTAGVDGMLCKLEPLTGNLLGKFRASTKAISSMSVSADGKFLATAAAQLKIFSCPDHKKLQKFSGHPGAVCCMIFSEYGKYVLSSAVGERYVAVWEIDGSKKKSACCVLPMDHPAVFLDSKCIGGGDADDGGLSVLAISEMGVCYFWCGKNVDELHNSKAAKILLSSEDRLPKSHRGVLPAIFAAKLQGTAKSMSGHIFLAYGLLIKPSFQKLLVQPGTDIKLTSSTDGILLPVSQSRKLKKELDAQNQIVALDRANAEGALRPIPKNFSALEGKSGAMPVTSKDDVEVDEITLCMEDRLRSQGILSNDDDLAFNLVHYSGMLKSINLEGYMPGRKMRAAVLSMTPTDAYTLLTVLLAIWQSRSSSGKYVLPWVCCLLVNHSDYVKSQEPATQLLDSLYKLTKSKGEAVHSLLQLSGRLQLVTAQIDKGAYRSQTIEHDQHVDESEVEDEDEEFLYGEQDDESQSTSEEDQPS